MPRALSRLRWQLTLSHLVAIAFTLVSMIGAMVLIATSWIGTQTNPAREPTRDAQFVAQAVGGIVTRGESAELNTILRAMVDGRLRLTIPTGPPVAHGPGGLVPSLDNVSYIAVVTADGRLVGSSDASGAAFTPPERDAWSALAAEAMARRRAPDLGAARTDGTTALGAYPVLRDDGRPVASVVVAIPSAALARPMGILDPLRALAIFGAVSVAVLGAASLFALASASFVAYLLSRRLVATLERLGRAVEELAAGDLAARAPVSGDDEVGQLGQRFNHMAADLERTMHELEAERDRVGGLLTARQQLVAGVSHELRTPVATVRGYLESILGRAHSGDLRADLETMDRELNRLQRLIDDLFTLSRAEVRQLELRPAPTDTGALVKRLVDTMAPLAWSQRRVQVIAEVAPDLPLANVDAERFEQMVSNLLGNAVRHTLPGGLVAVVVAAEPDALRLEVRDTGEGIAPEDLPYVFERFYRGQNEDGRGGAGLGLALVKELAEAMGGTVEAASVPGEGSCFELRLPLA